MRCDITVRIFKKNRTWRKVQCPPEATAPIINAPCATVAWRCMEHSEWTVANGHAQLINVVVAHAPRIERTTHFLKTGLGEDLPPS